MIEPPLLSVIIATRDRPALCLRAVQSVLAQTFTNVEVVVVDDSDLEENRAVCESTVVALDSRCRYVRLPKISFGHGPAVSRNVGVEKSSGEFVAFLDDDDCWSNADHLMRFHQFHVTHPVFDCFFTQQQALLANGVALPNTTWLGPLLATLDPRRIIGEGIYEIDPALLGTTNCFSHVNCTIVARRLFDNVGGFDQSLRYEEDKNFFFRVIDSAQKIALSEVSIGIHHVPDKTSSSSASNTISILDKKLDQVRSDFKLLASLQNRFLLRQREFDLAYNISELGAMYVERGTRAIGCSLRLSAFVILAYVRTRGYLRRLISAD